MQDYNRCKLVQIRQQRLSGTDSVRAEIAQGKTLAVNTSVHIRYNTGERERERTLSLFPQTINKELLVTKKAWLAKERC